MAEYVISDGMILIKNDATATIDAAVTSRAGFIDLSGQGLTMTLETTRNAVPLLKFGPNRLPQQLPGSRGGTIRFTFARNDGGTVDPHAIFTAIDNGNGRFNFVVQLINPDGDPVASAANPQWAGSVIITRLDHWGPGDGNSAAIIAVDGTLDRDFDTYP